MIRVQVERITNETFVAISMIIGVSVDATTAEFIVHRMCHRKGNPMDLFLSLVIDNQF
jgi:hypothetical protein